MCEVFMLDEDFSDLCLVKSFGINLRKILRPNHQIITCIKKKNHYLQQQSVILLVIRKIYNT